MLAYLLEEDARPRNRCRSLINN